MSQYKQVIAGGPVKSSTNEGSRSVGTFNHFKRGGVASEHSLSSHDSFTSSSKDRRLVFGQLLEKRHNSDLQKLNKLKSHSVHANCANQALSDAED